MRGGQEKPGHFVLKERRMSFASNALTHYFFCEYTTVDGESEYTQSNIMSCSHKEDPVEEMNTFLMQDGDEKDDDKIWKRDGTMVKQISLKEISKEHFDVLAIYVSNVN